MHELSVTKGLLKICIEEGERYKVKKINKVINKSRRIFNFNVEYIIQRSKNFN